MTDHAKELGELFHLLGLDDTPGPLVSPSHGPSAATTPVDSVAGSDVDSEDEIEDGEIEDGEIEDGEIEEGNMNFEVIQNCVQ